MRVVQLLEHLESVLHHECHRKASQS